MAKTKAQVEKQKRETEKRKKTEKAILKLAAGMPDEDRTPGPVAPSLESRAPKDKQ